jgi:hypothetical protein
VSLPGARLEGSSDFALVGSCPTSLGPGQSCALSVRLTPTSTGARSGAILLADDATGGPHQIPLSGRGVTEVLLLSRRALEFGSQAVGSSSTAPVVLSNAGTATVHVRSVSAGGDFREQDDCARGVAPGGSCSIQVTFQPTAAGQRTATLSIDDDAPGAPHTVSLSGAGTASFALAASGSATVSVAAGDSAPFPLQLTATPGFSDRIELTCSSPSGTSCAFDLPSVALDPHTPRTVTVFVQTTAPSVMGAFAALLLGPLSFALGRSGRRRRGGGSRRALAVLALGLACSSCGGSGPPSPPPTPSGGTPPGSYPLLVTARASHGETHQLGLRLIVTAR